MKTTKNILTAWFSKDGENYFNGKLTMLETGNTEVIARKIQELTGSDIFEIIPVSKYPVKYKETTKVAKVELNNNLRPELKTLPDSTDEYDIIFIGYPIWYGTMPMPVWTFLESISTAGKTIFPFCTHEGSGMLRSIDDLKTICSDAIILSGKSVIGSYVYECDRELLTWINNLNL